MTSQLCDFIKFQDNYYILGENEYPIKSYLESIGFDTADFVSYPANLDGFVVSTYSNCWRGYVAIWLIENGQLYLSDIRDPSLLKTYKQKIFGKHKKDTLTPATWYSGSLLLVGLFDADDQFISQMPPDITNVIPLNHMADAEILEEYGEAVLMSCQRLNIHNGEVTQVRLEDKVVYFR